MESTGEVIELTKEDVATEAEYWQPCRKDSGERDPSAYFCQIP